MQPSYISKNINKSILILVFPLLWSCSDDEGSSSDIQNIPPKITVSNITHTETNINCLLKLNDEDGNISSGNYVVSNTVTDAFITQKNLSTQEIETTETDGLNIEISNLEPNNKYRIIFSTIDNDGSTVMDTLIRITSNSPLNTPPDITITNTYDIPENSPIGTKVADYITSDSDGMVNSVKVTQGNFTATNGEVFTASAGYNFEDGNNTHALQLEATDDKGSETTSDTKTVLETNVLEPQMVQVFNDGLLANGENFVQVADEGIDVNDTNNWKIYKDGQMVQVFNDGLLANGENFVQVADEGIDVNDTNNWKIYKDGQPNRITYNEALAEIEGLTGWADTRSIIDGMNFDGTMPTHTNGVAMVQYNNDFDSVNYQHMELFDIDSSVVCAIPRGDYNKLLKSITNALGVNTDFDFNVVGTNSYNVHKKSMENAIENPSKKMLGYYEASQDHLSQ